MSPPGPTVAGPLFVTTTSDVTATEVFVVALLFERFGSVSLVEAFAVLVIVVPFAVVGFTRTAMLNVAEAPAASSAFVQVIVPVAPTAGFVQANEGPAVCVFETNVVFAGTASVIETSCAPTVPTLDTVTV